MNFIWVTVVGILVLVFVRTIYERVDGTGTRVNSVNAPARAGVVRRWSGSNLRWCPWWRRSGRPHRGSTALGLASIAQAWVRNGRVVCVESCVNVLVEHCHCLNTTSSCSCTDRAARAACSVCAWEYLNCPRTRTFEVPCICRYFFILMIVKVLGSTFMQL